VYAEDGSLLGEYGSGGSASSGTSQYLYLPTASGPMPIAAVIKGQTYAIHSDHLNTPRKLTQADGQAAWQWAYSAFGEEQPTTGAKRFTSEATTPSTGATSIPEVTFNLRYPGQYFDSETKLHYNHFRSYDGRTGRYTQADPIGLDGGWNRFGYVEGNPLSYIDLRGLDCISANGRTACRYPGGASFNIPSTPGFPASLGPSNLFYHKYDITQRIGNADRACILTMLQKYATPGNSNGASKEGTWNNAKVGPFNNPVKSYLTNDLVTGGTLIVNMTTKGGVFADGYVARGIVGDSIHTWGEGDSPWQSPTLTGYDTQYMANEIVWGIQMAEIVKQCSCTK
jgi:RHS repeat-associated protein